MTSLDILYYSLSVGVIVLVGFISYFLFQIAETVKHLKTVARDAENVTHDLFLLKDGVKKGVRRLWQELVH